MCTERLRSLYCTAMRFEAEFFGEHPGAPDHPHVALLAVDFDETCSVGDTIGTIIDTAIDAAVSRSTSPCQHPHVLFPFHELLLQSVLCHSYE